MNVLVPLAEGVEEMEAVIVIDVLRRAKWDVTVAGLKDGVVTASRGVKLMPDTTWDRIDASSFDLIAVPGGSRGVENLRKDIRVLDAIREQARSGKPLAAVCAGPLVLQEAGVLKGREVTSHPDVASQVTQAKRVDRAVVVDGNVITSQGAGTAMDFALAIVSQFDGPEKAAAVARGMACPRR